MSAQVLFQILLKGSFVTWLILALAVVAIGIVIERFLNLRHSQIDVQDFLPGVINTLRSQDVKQAVIICDETPGPAAHIVREVILHCEEGREGMYRAAKNACLSELPRLERFMKALLTIVHVAPLLGLLGTVIGMISIFHSMEGHGAGTFMSIAEMADGIWGALISTAAGLTVAIPSYLVYNYFREQIDNILIEMDKATVEIIYFLTQNPERLPLEEHEVIAAETADAVDEEQPSGRPDDTQELSSEKGTNRLLQKLQERREQADDETDQAAETSDESATEAFMKTVERKHPAADREANEVDEGENGGTDEGTATELFMRSVKGREK